MIVDFSISNFRSIRGMQTLSFEATNDNHLEDFYVVKIGKYRLLKIATILGANASGKSNVLRAFYMLPQLLLKPCKDKTSTIVYDKFALDEECKTKNTIVIVNFIVGEAKYCYEVEFDNKVVYREVLDCHPFAALKEHNVFKRFTDNESLVSTMKWGDKYRSASNTRILSANLLHNRTVFGSYQHSNVDIPWMKEILDWISKYFMPMVTTDDQKIRNYVSKNIINGKIVQKDFVRELMKADIGIGNVEIDQRNELINPDLVDAILRDDNAPEELKQKLQISPTSVVYDVRMSHNGHQGMVALDFEEESGGTQRYFKLSGLLLKVVNESRFLAIDELECKLHPDLYQHFVNTYIKNSRRSQIVFSTHMREFLADKDNFRDDSVWITEKSEKGDTELYSLADFDTEVLRGVSSRYNAYRAGRLGGIPRLGDTFVELSDGAES